MNELEEENIIHISGKSISLVDDLKLAVFARRIIHDHRS
jgi:hypothetical protein